MRLTAIHAALALLLAAAPAAAQEEHRPARARSVIYFIGDGMGPAQVTLGRLGAKARGVSYNFDRFEAVGLAATASADYPVTDSAAAGTALASGIKTNNQFIGMDPAGRPRETVLEVAHRSGFRTGLVTTTRITHATPAAFAAHVPHRDQEAEIAAQLAARSFPEVLIGGGARLFDEARRATLAQQGYTLIEDWEALAQVRAPRVAALLAKSHLPYAVDGGRPPLRELTRRAVELLAPEGEPFFLMVEGGRIDHACHQHDAIGAIHDQLDFDDAIGWALDLAQQRRDLLVVVTADHCTGSLGITEIADIPGLLAAKASTDAMIAQKDLVAAVKAATGFELTAEELATIREREGTYWGRTALGHLVSRRYGISWYDLHFQEDHLTNTHGHDGAHVPVFAFGPGAASFRGTYENNQVPRKIAATLGLPPIGLPVGAAGTQAPARSGK